MREMVKISVNGIELEAQKDSLLIDILLDKNIDIPHFCYHKIVGKDGNCRMCMVEIEGQKRPQIACDTPIKNGMIVRTKGDKIEKVRKDILELQLVNHPLDCPTCDQAGECKLQDYYMDSVFYENRVDVKKNKASKAVNLGRNVMLDQERCVLCTRCVRFFRNVTKTNELGVYSRADHSVIGTFPGTQLKSKYSMNIVDLCPVGALTSKDFRFKQRAWFMKSFNFICSHCSKGCNIYVDHKKEKYKDDEIYRLRPRINDSINGHFMCDRGRISYKEDNENRFTSIFCNNQIETFNNAKAYLLRTLEQENNVMIIVSPLLSCEEMQEALELSRKIGATVSGYSPQYIDENFGDDMLRKNDKSPNRTSFSRFGIDESSEHFEESLKKSSFLIILENNYFDKNQTLLNGKKIANFTASNTQINNFSLISIGISSFYEKNGTYINCDGVEQKIVSKLEKNNKSVDLKDFLFALNTML